MSLNLTRKISAQKYILRLRQKKNSKQNAIRHFFTIPRNKQNLCFDLVAYVNFE